MPLHHFSWGGGGQNAPPPFQLGGQTAPPMEPSLTLIALVWKLQLNYVQCETRARICHVQIMSARVIAHTWWLRIIIYSVCD